MATLEEKIDYLVETKDMIKKAIIDKGQVITERTPFREYADKIEAISSSGPTEDLTEVLETQADLIAEQEEQLRNIKEDLKKKASSDLPEYGWDTEKIIQEYIDENPNKNYMLLLLRCDSHVTVIMPFEASRVIYSDGTIIENNKSKYSIEHIWDFSGYAVDKSGRYTRWILLEGITAITGSQSYYYFTDDTRDNLIGINAYKVNYQYSNLFNYCSFLEYVDNIDCLGNSSSITVTGCNNLKRIYFNNSGSYRYSTVLNMVIEYYPRNQSYSVSTTTQTFPKHLKFSEDYFNNKSSNSSIFPGSVESITNVNLQIFTNSSLFSYCTKLKEINNIIGTINRSLSLSRLVNLSLESYRRIMEALEESTDEDPKSITLPRVLQYKDNYVEVFNIALEKNWAVSYS